MTVDEIFSFVKFLARKNSTGTITPSEFNATLKSAETTEFNTLIGEITVAPHVALGQNERIAERLKPFKVTDQTIAVSSQIATYPTGFHAITAMTTAGGADIQYIDDTKLKDRLKSVIDPIAEADPGVYTLAATGWKIWPSTITSILASYYKAPTGIKWAYNTVSNRPVYDSANSIQPVWDAVSLEKIIARQCTLLGISFQSQNLVQYGAMVKTEGA